jgi:uncharacterized protein (DUF608 family)
LFTFVWAVNTSVIVSSEDCFHTDPLRYSFLNHVIKDLLYNPCRFYVFRIIKRIFQLDIYYRKRSDVQPEFFLKKYRQFLFKYSERILFTVFPQFLRVPLSLSHRDGKEIQGLLE